jgi:hypothetical protein
MREAGPERIVDDLLEGEVGVLGLLAEGFVKIGVKGDRGPHVGIIASNREASKHQIRFACTMDRKPWLIIRVITILNDISWRMLANGF